MARQNFEVRLTAQPHGWGGSAASPSPHREVQDWQGIDPDDQYAVVWLANLLESRASMKKQNSCAGSA